MLVQSGKLKAVSWEADPGVFVYRRSIAKEVLGTDDPDKVQEAISDWNKFEEVAGKMKEKGYKMLSGYDDAYRVFSNNVSAPWVNANEEVVIDPKEIDWSKAPYNWNLQFVQFPEKAEEAEAHSQIMAWIRAGVLNPKDFISEIHDDRHTGTVGNPFTICQDLRNVKHLDSTHHGSNNHVKISRRKPRAET